MYSGAIEACYEMMRSFVGVLLGLEASRHISDVVSV